MDRPLTAEDIRNRRLRKGTLLGVSALALVVTLVLLAGWAQPGVRRSAIQTATVTRGRLEVTVEAAGVVVPSFEQSVSSPVEARVLRVLRQPGTVVRSGDELVQLDLSQLRLELEKVEQQLAQKQNEAARARVVSEGDVASMRRQIEQRKLDFAMLHYRAEQNRKLRNEGLVSEDVLRESEVAEKKAEIEVRQLEAQIAQLRRTAGVDDGSNALSRQMLERERAEAARQMELATARADRDGVLTWVTPEEGVTVRRGDVLARIANLDRLRVQGSISDVHAKNIRAGLPVRVKGGSETYGGHIASVDPSASDGVVKFFVDLDDPRAPLHNKQRVDVFVVSSDRPSTLKVRRGYFADSGEIAQVFVLEGDRAVRHRVRLGAIGYDEVEVLEGLQAGDVVITSDTKEYETIKQVRIR
jgi:HlyD family secretion protein